MRRQRPRADHGFTLVELLVVVVILGVLAAIAVPTFLSVRAKSQDAEAVSNLRNALTAQVQWVTINPQHGYLDFWQDSSNRVNQMAELQGGTDWYNGWGGSSPSPGQVMVIAGHNNSGSWTDDWLLLTARSRSGTCFSISREDTSPTSSGGYVTGTFYWSGPSSNGACPATANGNAPPSTTPTGPATATSWGTSW